MSCPTKSSPRGGDLAATKDERSDQATVERNEVRSSMENTKPGGDMDQIIIAQPQQATFFADFASRDAAWVAFQNKRLIRKVDTRLLPLLIALYMLNFLDRSNLAQAREGSLEEDLGMSGTDFNLATSIFFIGYLVMQLPSNMLITRVRPSFYLASAVTIWGVVSTCNAATSKFSDLVAVRFFLGFVEAPFFPGAVFLMSSWYTRTELTRRISWFYSGNALANMFGGLIAAGVLGNLDGSLGIAGWRWLFIIEGSMTIALGLVAGFILPDYPATTRWLTEEERAFAAWRLLDDINESDDAQATTVWDGIKLALKDYRIYVFVLFQHLSLLSQTFQYFFPSIVGTLGYGHIVTLLLTVPVWFATFLTSIFVTLSAARTQDRSLHICGLMLVAALGNAIAAGTTNKGARFFSLFLMPMGSISAYTIIVPWVANSFPRPLVKRSAAVAIANCIGNTASAYGSYMYPSSDGPRYIPGGSANAAVSVLVAILALVLRVIHQRENKKLEKAETESRHTGPPEARAGNVRVAGFRYVY